MRTRSGLTRLELVVVVALMGILTALLLPVVARRRAALPDAKCIANVKAIATAIHMYAEEYEGLWPGEQNATALEYFGQGEGRGMGRRGLQGNCSRASKANPYLRPPVILERYMKNRWAWYCPRAPRVNRAAWIVPVGANGDWIQGYREHEGEWGLVGLARGKNAEEPRRGLGGMTGPCLSAFPPGWGGTVTDSFRQGAGVSDTSVDAPVYDPPAFAQSIATSGHLTDLKLSQVGNPAKHIVCGDCGIAFEVWDVTGLAFPDTCATAACGYTSGEENCANPCNQADWGNCPWTHTCGLSSEAKDKLLTDAKYRKTLTRHSGGSNVGFLDGHAKWYTADYLLTHSKPFKRSAFEGDLCACWPGNGKVPAEAGQPGPPRKKPSVKPTDPEMTEEAGD